MPAPLKTPNQRRARPAVSLLGEPVTAAGDDQALHVVRDEFHRVCAYLSCAATA
jgi:hypothetical protein